MIFLDTNIILRFILNDDPKLSPKAKAIFQKIQDTQTNVYIGLLSFSEVVFTLERSYRFPKIEVVKNLLFIMRIPSIKMEKKQLIQTALKEYIDKNISFIDAYSAVLMKKQGIKQIYSFDRDFDKFRDLQRLET